MTSFEECLSHLSHRSGRRGFDYPGPSERCHGHLFGGEEPASSGAMAHNHSPAVCCPDHKGAGRDTCFRPGSVGPAEAASFELPTIHPAFVGSSLVSNQFMISPSLPRP